jgi:type II secretory pathway pseudopilin PulG
MEAKKKQALTLLEIMIVIFLIALIGSVVGYNVKGSLEEGKAFRTEQGAALIRDILLLEVAKGQPVELVLENKEAFLKSSGLVKDVKKLLKDGWGQPYTIAEGFSGGDIVVSSLPLKTYKERKRIKLKDKTTIQEPDADDSEDNP